MPNCSKCNKSQSRLNRGDLCKECFDIYKKSQLNIENTIVLDDINGNSINSDRSIIEMIKEHMLHETQWHNETLE